MATSREMTPPIKSFSVTLAESYLDWKRRVFDIYARSKNWNGNEKAHNFLVYLQDITLDYYVSLPAQTQDDWEALAQVFTDHFHTDLRRGAVACVLRNFRHKPGMSVVHYTAKLGSLLRETFFDLDAATLERLLGQYFNDKLLPEIREHINLTQPGAGYNESFLLAQNYENAKLLKYQNLVAPDTARADTTSQVFAAGFAIRLGNSRCSQMAFSGQRSSSYSRHQPPSHSAPHRQDFQSGAGGNQIDCECGCHRCGQLGHFRWACPQGAPHSRGGNTQTQRQTGRGRGRGRQQVRGSGWVQSRNSTRCSVNYLEFPEEGDEGEVSWSEEGARERAEDADAQLSMEDELLELRENMRVGRPTQKH